MLELAIRVGAQELEFVCLATSPLRPSMAAMI
jgi:hypothetical protein